MNLWELYNDNFNFDYEYGIVFDKCNNVVIPSYSISGQRRNEIPSVYLKIYLDGKRHMLHRVLYISKSKVTPDIVDHIDGDTFNNSLCNLRGVTHRENSLNRKLSAKNMTGHIGVSVFKDKFVSTIYHDKKKIYLGTFSDISEAIRVRKEAELKYNYHVNHGRVEM